MLCKCSVYELCRDEKALLVPQKKMATEERIHRSMNSVEVVLGRTMYEESHRNPRQKVVIISARCHDLELGDETIYPSFPCVQPDRQKELVNSPSRWAPVIILCVFVRSLPRLEVAAAVTTVVATTITTTTITIVTTIISIVCSNQAVSIRDDGGSISTDNHCHLP